MKYQITWRSGSKEVVEGDTWQKALHAKGIPSHQWKFIKHIRREGPPIDYLRDDAGEYRSNQMKPHKLPRQEEVTEVDLGSHQIKVVRVTDENMDSLLAMALSMYLGEGCKYCSHIFETFSDLKMAVFAGYHERGRLACKSCWESNNPSHDPKAFPHDG